MAPQQLNVHVLCKLRALWFFAKQGFYVINFSKPTLSSTSKQPLQQQYTWEKKKRFLTFMYFSSPPFPPPLPCPQGHLVKKAEEKHGKLRRGEENTELAIKMDNNEKTLFKID